MSGFTESLITAQSAGAALTNTVTQTSLLPAQAKFGIAANRLAYVGMMIKLRASGKMSTAASSPGTLSFFFMMGATAVFLGGASPTVAVSATNLTWKLEMDMVVNIDGSVAAVLGTGALFSAALSAATPVQLLPTSAPANGSTFDATVLQVADLQAAWSVASASNSITLQTYELILSQSGIS